MHNARIVKVVDIFREKNLIIVKDMDGIVSGITVPEEEISSYQELDVLAVVYHLLLKKPEIIIKGDVSWWLSRATVGWVERVCDELVIVKTNEDLFCLSKSDVDVNVGDLVRYNSVDNDILQVIPKDQLTDTDKELPSDEKNEYLVDVQKLDLTFEDFGGYPAIVKRAR
ncbi:hypothetical protein, partial [Corynebacterium matruchotii]|uniref:hypothetical protein n=1 Tax=Corynebacterium matruchotii TaxID=43768 RepID=UPI0028E5525E